MSSLAELLENRGMRLIDLARKMNVNKGTVSRWNENGVPPRRVKDVEEAAGIPACDLCPELARVFAKSKGTNQ